jgi:inorganic pyrophosphatase
MWHHVDLHVKTWLDEETGLFRYVNEIPRGSLQKFELQTRLVENVIREDVKGSRKLKAFGCPVPFNYGCLPQTFRDPDELDDIFGAPGDDDPLDILDLCSEAQGVGEVVCCRPLGAVCLIDEGQADWKIIAVNTEGNGPLAGARSIEEAERLAPGRIEEALRWMDEFKQHSSKSDTTLHYEIHDAKMAISIIEKDHAAWRRLVAEATASGTSKGHWIRAPMQKEVQPQVMKFGWPCQVGSPSPLTGSSVPAASYATSRALTMCRQTSGKSDGGDSSSGWSDRTSASPRSSSDAEIAA